MAGRIAAFASILFAPSIALASSESAGASTLVWHAVNLLLLLALLVYFARSPIQSFMAERRSSIEQNLEAARRELESAESRLAECKARVDSLDREIEEIRSAVRAQAESERDRLLADARAAADRIRRDAQLAVEQEGRRARSLLRKEAAEMAVRLAADLLKRQVGDADRARLVDEFVAHIESPPRPAARS